MNKVEAKKLMIAFGEIEAPISLNFELSSELTMEQEQNEICNITTNYQTVIEKAIKEALSKYPEVTLLDELTVQLHTIEENDPFIELDEDIQEYMDFLESKDGQVIIKEYEKDAKMETA